MKLHHETLWFGWQWWFNGISYCKCAENTANNTAVFFRTAVLLAPATAPLLHPRLFRTLTGQLSGSSAVNLLNNRNVTDKEKRKKLSGRENERWRSADRELPLSHDSHQSIIIVHFTAPASPTHNSSEIRRVRLPGFGKIIHTQSQVLTSYNCSTMVFCVLSSTCTRVQTHTNTFPLQASTSADHHPTPSVLLQSTINLFIWALLTGSLVGVWDKRVFLSALSPNRITGVHEHALLDGCVRFSHLDRSFHLWLLITKPHHPHDCHGNAEPVEEAEEVYDGKDVVGEGIEQRHQAL